MRCTNCGLPLSPTSTSSNCPRCHIALVSEAKPIAAYPGFPPVAQIPLPQAGQMWRPDPTPSPLPTPEPMEAAVRNISASDMRDARTVGALPSGQGMMHSKPTPILPVQRGRVGNGGFILAGLCVITGGLILVFVYFMASGLPSINTTSGSMETTKITGGTLPPATIAPSPTILLSPSVEAFPGQQYIDNAQLASAINTNTAQPIQTATTFKANQRIYVTFNIHPNGKSGAVCLFWYLNKNIITQYPFAVTAAANAGYSYATYGAAGVSYVEIYWASSTTCSDKILAQHVNFTVTH